MGRTYESMMEELEVIEILSTAYDGDEFPGYENIRLSFSQLETIIRNKRSGWLDALRNQKAVYLITDTSNGKMYVGSATAQYGMLLQRWTNYIDNGHGGNVELKGTLDALVDGSSAKYHELMKTIKDAEEKMAANKVIKTHIINYAKTRETYIAYRKSGNSKKFYEAHRDEITLHKAAKEAFAKLPDGKIPKVKDLNEEFVRLLSEKKAPYSEYKKIKKEMRDYQIAKQNVESFYAAQQSWDIEEDMKKKRQQER